MNAPSDNDHLAAMQRQSVERRRRYWLWMAFLPALLELPLVWIGLGYFDRFQSAVYDRVWGSFLCAALFWNGWCAVKLVKLGRQTDPFWRVAAGIGWFIALALLNTVLGIVLLWGSCIVISRFI